LAEARTESARSYEQSVGQFSNAPPPAYILAEGAALAATATQATVAAAAAAQAATFAGGGEPPAQAVLLRDIFGNPFRPPPRPQVAWLTWNDGTVRRLAEAIYNERSLPKGHLDGTRIGVLADALEDAGCADPDLLGHLRGLGPHLRGCWAVDLLLGKE
jgi:hypothetical protein